MAGEIVQAAQVTIRWGQQVVAVCRVGSERSRRLGELLGGGLAHDEGSWWSQTVLEVGDDRRLRVVRRGRKPRAVSRDEVIRVCVGELDLEVVGVGGRATRRPGPLTALLAGGNPFMAASGLAHLLLLAFFAYASPALAAAGEGELDDAQRRWVQRHVRSATSAEVKGGPRALGWAMSDGGTGTRAYGPEGAAGDPTAEHRRMRAANRWRARNSRPRLPRRAAAGDVDAEIAIGMADLLLSDGVSEPEPTATWPLPGAQGNRLVGALGGMWGGRVGRSFGAAGLGLSGVGEGGGGLGFGIGLGRVGTIGRGAGSGRGAGLGRSHRARPPRLRCGTVGRELESQAEALAAGAESPDATIICVAWSDEAPDQCTRWRLHGPCNTGLSGRLPPEAVQRVMRRNHGRFRGCYQQGLVANPALRGRVSLRFVIRRDGSVGQVSARGDLPDAAVKACVAQAMKAVTFPRPEGGVVTTRYPLMLTPID